MQPDLMQAPATVGTDGAVSLRENPGPEALAALLPPPEPELARLEPASESERLRSQSEPVVTVLAARRLVAADPADLRVASPEASPARAATCAEDVTDLAGAALTAFPGKRFDAAATAIERNFAPADPLFGNQWHLLNTGQNGAVPGVDINVTRVWDEFTGRGVTVGIWDDGIEYTHPDLIGSYDPGLHILINGTPHDPFPASIDSNHGTAVAGLIAAANNGIGGVGVAFGATIAGVDMFFDLPTDEEYYESFTRLNMFDITNHSWGYTKAFDNNILNPDSAAFFVGWKDSVITGRGGLGTINVTSAGNNRLQGRDANDSSKNAMIETIVVAAVSHDGYVARYSTPGASVLIGSTSNGAAGAGIWTTDITGSLGYNDGSNQPLLGDADYTSLFGGTSAASPIAAGVVALMLEANPDLGWRDVQTILAATARHTGSAIRAAPTGTELYAWAVNGARTWNGGGMHFSNDYGFGLIDALAAVRLAQSWKLQSTSANWKQEVAATWTGDMVIPDDNIAGVSFDLNVTEDMALEHVELKLTWQTGTAFTGDYLITLTSPDGTTSYLSRPRNDGYSATWSWVFMSNQFRGETSVGTWTVHISDRWLMEESSIIGAELTLSGAEKSVDDIWIFTNAYSDLAGGAFGHATALADTNGGQDTLNAAAVSAATRIDLSTGTGQIDGVAVTLQGFEHAIGGDGNDTLIGDAQDNILQGARGNDRIEGQGGADRLGGGQGNDTLDGGDGGDQLVGHVGNDRLFGGNGDDTLQGGIGHDRIRGGNGNDLVQGAQGNDLVFGGSGNDTLYGGAGADTLFGGAGQDWLYDGDGADQLYGGAGADVFALSTDAAQDRILDFELGKDRLLIIGYNFGDFSFADNGPGSVLIGYGADLLQVDALAGALTAASFDESVFIFV
ncbi:MAG: S8 family serine peptidase [Gemmobacter sp.]